MRRSPSAAVLFAFTLVSLLHGQVLSSTGQILPYIADLEGARQAEIDLQVQKDNVDLNGQLLDFYIHRWKDAGIRAARLRIILWTIANHPDIQFTGAHDSRGLLVNPDDKNDYAQVRQAWLEQVASKPDNARVLANAAQCLRLSDRETAVSWLKQAITLEPGNGFFLLDLGTLYANAITGISGMNPWEGPTSVDSAETRSQFAKLAKEEASRDAILAGRTGWAVHLNSDAIRIAKLNATDYDRVAEELLRASVDLDYPNPARLPFLGDFYRAQERKAADRILPKFRIVEVKPEEQEKQLVEKTKRLGFTDKNFHAPVTIAVRIVIGIDGHVWKAEAVDGLSSTVGSVAASSTLQWIYKPLRIDGEPVLVSTIVHVTVEPL